MPQKTKRHKSGMSRGKIYHFLKRRSLPLMFFFITTGALGAETMVFPKKLTFAKLTLLENQSRQWIEEKSSTQLNNLFSIRPRPIELEIIMDFFPQLLPENFPFKNIFNNCQKNFTKFRAVKTSKAFLSWKKCITVEYGNNLDIFLRQAVADLAPQKSKK